jgi:hypothetical protein
MTKLEGATAGVTVTSRESGAYRSGVAVTMGKSGALKIDGGRVRLYRRGPTYVYTVAPGWWQKLWAWVWGQQSGWRVVRSRHAPGSKGAPDGVPLACCTKEP